MDEQHQRGRSIGKALIWKLVLLLLLICANPLTPIVKLLYSYWSVLHFTAGGTASLPTKYCVCVERTNWDYLINVLVIVTRQPQPLPPQIETVYKMPEQRGE